MDQQRNPLQVQADDLHEKTETFTENDMKNHLLAGDAISVTTRREQGNFDRKSPHYVGPEQDTLIKLPTEDYEI